MSLSREDTPLPESAEASAEASAASLPTSADVARRAGVSRATVSYVLNNTPGQKISPKTREAVMRAAAELGYRPNLAAKSLAGGSGLLLFVLSGAAQNDLTTAIASNLTVALARVGVMVAVHFDGRSPEILREVIRDLQPRAVVFSAPPSAAIRQVLAEQRALAIESIIPESAAGAASLGALQVRYLVGRGHRHIAYADAADAETWLSQQRRRDVGEACAAAGLLAPLVAAFSADGQGAPATIRAWHARQVTAICAYNDEVALAVLYGVREAGLRCPDDIAVIGLDGIAAGAVAYPPLTTIAIHTQPAAEWYAQSLLYQLNLAPLPAIPHDIFTLIERAST